MIFSDLIWLCNVSVLLIAIVVVARHKGRKRFTKIIVLALLIGWLIAGTALELTFLAGTIQTEYMEEWKRGDYREIVSPAKHTILTTTANIRPIWEKDLSETDVKISAADGRLFVNTKGISAFNGSTGHLLWQTGIEPNLLHATNEKLYVGTGPGLVGPHTLALDPRTGALLWKGNPVRARQITYIYESDGLLYSTAGRGSTGGIHQVQQTDNGNTVVITDFIRFVVDEEEWKVIVPDSERAKFPAPINLDRFLAHKRPATLWQREELIETDIEASGTGVVFGLAVGGKLEGRNYATGEITHVVQFQPEKFHSHSWHSQAYSYSVAVDEEQGLVYVWLGDSSQLFAFEFSA